MKNGKEMMRKAEVKIAIIIVYDTLTGVIGLIAFTVYINAAKIVNISESLGELFLCESTGTQDCADVNFESLTNSRIVLFAATIMANFAAVVTVVFSLDPAALKMTIRKCKCKDVFSC